MGAFDPRKLAELAKNPGNGRRLVPEEDWLLGIVGGVAGVLGFTFWVWAVQRGMRRSFNLFEDMVFTGVVGTAPVGAALWISIVSVAALIASLALLGNRLGAKKRGWMEIAAFQGGAQLWFGAAYFLCGIVSLAAWNVSVLAMGVLLLLNFYYLVSQAEELHEVDTRRKLPYLAACLGVYFILVYALIAIF